MILFNPKVLKISGIESLDNLIRGLIEISPDKRFSMDVYLNHPFFKEDYKQITNLDFPVKSCEKKELKEDSSEISKYKTNLVSNKRKRKREENQNQKKNARQEEAAKLNRRL
jgi:serine/threonine protein kinase